MIRIGIVGTGRIGCVHAECLARLPGARLVGVTDLSQEAARSCAERLGVPHVTTVEALLALEGLDAVAICSSTDTHADLIERAADAGKHVFCEKPIDASLARIDRTLQAVERTGVQLMVGFNRRFDSNHQRIRQAVALGEVGTPHLLHIVSRDPAPPPLSYIRTSGGMFFDMTIHDFDMARFLLGEVDEIFACAGVRVDPAIGEAGDVDTALVTLRFASGAMGSIDNSRAAAYGYDQRVEVFGSLGVVRSDNQYHDEVQLQTASRVERGLPKNFFMDRYRASYSAEMAAFIECLATGTPVPVSGRDGRVPVVMALAARRSLEQNRPVRLFEVESAGADVAFNGAS